MFYEGFSLEINCFGSSQEFQAWESFNFNFTISTNAEMEISQLYFISKTWKKQMK